MTVSRYRSIATDILVQGIIATMFWKKSKKNQPAASSGGGLQSAKLPDGVRVYAIGDIHGRDDLFALMIEAIRADMGSRPLTDATVILLGDLVDRGPDSDKVVERAYTLKNIFPDTRYIIGNHEECFLAALTGDVRKLRYFARIGGDATMRSYWKDDEEYQGLSFDALAAGLLSRVPQHHIDFLGHGEDIIEIGDYLFVHAGIRPGVDLAQQQLTDLRWIRDEFLDHVGDHGFTVVHGHSVTNEPDVQANRIGIDTGAFRSGCLTALVLEGRERRFLTAEI